MSVPLALNAQHIKLPVDVAFALPRALQGAPIGCGQVITIVTLLAMTMTYAFTMQATITLRTLDARIFLSVGVLAACAHEFMNTLPLASSLPSQCRTPSYTLLL